MKSSIFEMCIFEISILIVLVTVTMNIKIDQHNSIEILISSSRLGQRTGAYTFKECSMILDAIHYFDRTTDKSSILKSFKPEDKEFRAFKILVDAVRKAQQRGGEYSFSIEDGAVIFRVISFLLEHYREPRMEKIRKKIAARKILRWMTNKVGTGKGLHDFLWSPGGPMMDTEDQFSNMLADLKIGRIGAQDVLALDWRTL